MTDPGRLPRNAVPTRYDLTLEPDLAGGRFGGEVAVALSVAAPADEVVLHAHELDVELVELVQAGRVVPAALAVDAPGERVAVRPREPLAPGAATLRLRFSGRLADGLVGLYRSRFVDDGGTERVLAATQFEAPHARRAFPCFDEPDLKATFAVTLVVEEGATALSNGPEVARERLPDGRVRVRFGETIPMSTYLVAAVAGPLEISGPVEARGVPVRVAHVPGRGHLTGYALEVAVFALGFFEDYYGIRYPAEKLDLVALPDFAFGAMENLGCVTFRESLLLVDTDTVTQTEATNVALTTAHEIAHMWFGDLVTMRWWNGIWLNEAFATFMEHAAVDAFRSEWRTWDDFALGRAAAKEIDALSTTRPVEYEVRTPEDADGMFDVLTYQKGGSVVRMLEQWLGPDAFRDGVRLYLDRHRFGNTETTDLWDAIEEAAGRPVRRIMDSWIFQPGLPEVVVEPDGAGGRVRLRQRRFSYGADTGGPGDGRWSIPLRVRTGGGRVESVLLDGASTVLETAGDGPVVVHAGGEGFFRVAYPREWRAAMLASGTLSPLERFALVDDLWAAVLAGRAEASELVALARDFASERDLVVWRILTTRLREAARLVGGEALDALRADVRALVGPAFAAMGWAPSPGEGPRDRQLRGLLLDALGTLARDADVAARARDGHEDPEVAAAALAVVAETGTEEEFDGYVERADRAPTPQEQLRHLYALAQFPSERLVLRACELALSDRVRTQNGPFLLQRALRHAEHGRRAWELVRDRWDDVEARFPRTLIPRMLEGVTWLVDDASVAEVPAFCAAHPVPEGERVVAQHLERQRVHRATLERERDRFAAALLSPP
jgi:puromycin-sensitive aminopeptidase